MATINDVILIYLEDSPISFARVESILPDHKKDWYQIKLLMLQLPMQAVTWILKDSYISGDEFFMNGKKMRMEKVECPGEEMTAPAPRNLSAQDNDQKDQTRPQATPSLKQETKPARENQGKIISFTDLKNNAPKPG